MRSRSEGRVELFRVFWRQYGRLFLARLTVLFGSSFPRRPGCETGLFVLKIGPSHGFLVIADRVSLSNHYNPTHGK